MPIGAAAILVCDMWNRHGCRVAMARRGIRCVLVRDLTDAMCDPKDPPFVSHDEGTERVVRHIEAHGCPSIVSEDLLLGLARRKGG